jgi:TonB-dependent receptor
MYYVNTSYGQGGEVDGGYTRVAVSVTNFTEDASWDRLVGLPSTGVNYSASAARTRANRYDWRVNPGIRHAWGDFKVEYDVYYSQSQSQNRSDTAAYQLAPTSARPDGQLGFIVENTNSKGDARITQISGPDFGDLNNYTNLAYTLQRSNGVEKRMGGKINVVRPWLFAVPVQIQAGMRYDKNIRRFTNPALIYYLTGPDARRDTIDDPTLGSFANTARGNYMPWATLEGRLADWVDVGMVQNYLAEHPEMFTPDWGGNLSRSLDNAKEYEDSITAAYGMATIKFGALDIMGGVRYEYTALKATGNVRNLTYGNLGSDTYAPEAAERERARRHVITGTAEYDDWFPSIHFKYKLGKPLQFRASATRTIGRPNISLGIIPVEEIDETRTNNYGATGRIIRSNPGLRPSVTHSFDFDVEYYFKHSGIVSISLYQKTQTGYISTISEQVGAGPDNGFDGMYEGFEFQMARNVGDVRRRGIEARYDQQLRFLPGIFRNLRAYVSYTHNDVTMDVYDTLGRPSSKSNDCPGIMPNIINGGINYNGRHLKWTIRGDWKERYLFERNTGDRRRYFDTRFTLDASFSYKIAGRWELSGDMRNILGSEATLRHMTGMISWQERVGRSLNLMLKVNF